MAGRMEVLRPRSQAQSSVPEDMLCVSVGALALTAVFWIHDGMWLVRGIRVGVGNS